MLSAMETVTSVVQTHAMLQVEGTPCHAQRLTHCYVLLPQDTTACSMQQKFRLHVTTSKLTAYPVTQHDVCFYLCIHVIFSSSNTALFLPQ